jgi:lipopolysaccharide/colanic/teichoic acid biosynthesis glycosyltransferase
MVFALFKLSENALLDKNMKKLSKKIKNFSALLMAVGVSVFIVTTGWAALTLVDSAGYRQSQDTTMEEYAMVHSGKSKSHAPEPATLALFGSGIFGMIISFVRKTYHIAKRIFDVVLSVVALIVLSPLFLFTALLVKCTSKGPMLFTQIRAGKDEKPFKMYKFRTMKVDAEKESGPVWAAVNDSRLIPVGAFDEIPQFINVLRGEMSVIGPRPERPIFIEKLKREISDYEKRLAIKPGITGLAQVWHRYDETIADVRKKVKYDILYIKKVCLWTDLRILLRTVRVVFTGEGAR